MLCARHSDLLTYDLCDEAVARLGLQSLFIRLLVNKGELKGKLSRCFQVVLHCEKQLVRETNPEHFAFKVVYNFTFCRLK